MQLNSAPWETALQEALELGLSAGTAEQLSLLACVHLGSRVVQGERAKAPANLLSLSLVPLVMCLKLVLQFLQGWFSSLRFPGFLLPH